MTAGAVAYLNDLIALEDPVIMAAAAEYQDTMVFDDFADTLMRMGSRWILTLSVNNSMLLELLLSLQTDKLSDHFLSFQSGTVRGRVNEPLGNAVQRRSVDARRIC